MIGQIVCFSISVIAGILALGAYIYHLFDPFGDSIAVAQRYTMISLVSAHFGFQL